MRRPQFSKILADCIFFTDVSAARVRSKSILNGLIHMLSTVTTTFRDFSEQEVKAVRFRIQLCRRFWRISYEIWKCGPPGRIFLFGL
jgi:hypothetical protein